MPRHRRRTERFRGATVGTNLIVENIKRLAFGSGTSRTIHSGSSCAVAHDGNITPSDQYDPATHASSRSPITAAGLRDVAFKSPVLPADPRGRVVTSVPLGRLLTGRMRCTAAPVDQRGGRAGHAAEGEAAIERQTKTAS